MTYEELEHNELERMKYNALKVCDELSLRIDGAAGPNNRPLSYSEKESQSNDTLLHFVEFFNVHNSD